MQAHFARPSLAALSLCAVVAAAGLAHRIGTDQPGTSVFVSPAEAQLGFRRVVSKSSPSKPGHSFFFARAIYSGSGFRPGWNTDYPKADLQFISVLRRLTDVDSFSEDFAVRLDDPDLRRYPFLYALEVGGMRLTEAEVQGLRDYLLAGGFLMIDDFWGSFEWRNFRQEMSRVLPDYDIVDIPLDHPIFSTVYKVDEIIQVPNVDQGMWGGPTHEQDGYVPHVRGIFDDEGRLMVVINWNTDLGDAWEWAEQAAYPLEYSTYAFQMGANFIVYAMTR